MITAMMMTMIIIIMTIISRLRMSMFCMLQISNADNRRQPAAHTGIQNEPLVVKPDLSQYFNKSGVVCITEIVPPLPRLCGTFPNLNWPNPNLRTTCCLPKSLPAPH